MSALVLRLKEAPPERLDLSALNPQGLAALDAAAIARLPVGTSRRGVRLGDCFAITPGDPAQVAIEGGSDRLDGVGARWPSGTALTVEGDVGQRLGLHLAGATLTVRGSAGPFAGSGAKAGLIVLEGDADAHAGGALHGAPGGLDGATLVIRGRAGPRLGDRMRGGLILAGAAGAFAGSQMIAGTLVAGDVGDWPGYGMRRGTLLVGGHGALLPTFVPTGTHRLVAARLLRRVLDPLSPRLAELAEGALERHAGDLATLGKGEILRPVRP